MNPNIPTTDRLSVEAVINPLNQGAGAVSTAWISMSEIGSVLAMLSVGVMSTNSTVDAVVEQAKDGAGADAKAVEGKVITQLTESGGDAGTQVLLNVSESDLDVSSDFGFVRLTVNVGTAASFISAFLLGFDASHFPKEHADTVSEAVA